jgi:uncharacterized protein YdeI (YjbR/CyaY-like superfamily)
MVITEQINLYIAERPEWQRKLLVRLRQLIHTHIPEAREGWQAEQPCFEHADERLGLAAQAEHVSLLFYNSGRLKDPKKLLAAAKGEEKGTRAYSLGENDKLNEPALADLLKQVLIPQDKAGSASDTKPVRKVAVMPSEFEQVLHKDPAAWANWEAFPPSHKREYVEWITDAKQEETRKRRIAQALEKIRHGVHKEEKHKVH